MKREVILPMKPGRELDALMAEYVFGWRKVHGPKTDYNGPCESFDVLVSPTIKDPFPLYPPKGVIKPWYFCNNWSTDISTAWEVVEKFNYDFILSNKQEIWYCRMISYFDDDMVGHYVTAEGKTAPEAICKAALLAVLEGENHG